MRRLARRSHSVWRRAAPGGASSRPPGRCASRSRPARSGCRGPRRVEGTRCVGRVVLLGELLDKSLGLLLVDGDAAVLLLLEPGEDAVIV